MSDIQSPDEAFRSTGATADRDQQGRFLAGNKSSPGRKYGSRVKLSQKFFEALSADFEEHGEGAIARVRFLRPDVYFAVVARLMPQKIEVTTPTDGISDERLAELIEICEAKLDAKRAQPGDDAKPVRVIDVEPIPIGPPPLTSAEQRAQAQRRDLNDQHDALAAVEPVAPAPAPLRHPVGRVTPEPTRTIERRNIAKLVADDIDVDPMSLF